MTVRRLLSVSILMMVLAALPAAAAFDPEAYGPPRVQDLYLVILRDPDAQLLALEGGKIDIVSDLVRPVDIAALSKNPAVDMSLASGFHAFFLGFNARTFPWSEAALRRAASRAIPREQIVRDLFSGYAEPLATYLPPASPYFEPDVTTYPYDPDGAAKALADAGWTRGSDGVLVSPGGRRVPPQKILSPTASVAPTTTEIAVRAAEALTSIGIPTTAEPMDFSTMLARLDKRQFDMYVMAWSMGKDPDSLYSFYSSKMDVPGGYNLAGMKDEALDETLDRLKFAPDEEAAARAAQEAQRMLSDLVPAVPLYSRYSISAIRKGWKNVFTSERTTADNLWSLLAMEPESGPMRPLYLAQADEPRALNPFTSTTAYDWQILGMIYDGLIASDPETLEDMPWLAESWSVETEEGPEGPKTVLTFRLRKGVSWQDGRPFTAEDVAATIEFLRKNEVPRYYDNVMHVETVTTPDHRTLSVTMRNRSFWHLHGIGGLPLFPKHVLDRIQDWRTWMPAAEKSPDDPSLTGLVGTGPFVFREYRPGEYVRMTANEAFWLGRTR